MDRSLPRPEGRRRRLALLAGSAVAVAVGLALSPRIAQDPAYHLFADSRRLLGIPNALDVLSNAAFAAAGLAGLSVASRSRALRRRPERLAWFVLFGGVVAVALVSARYHLSPSNETLFWDRLAMSVAFAGLVSALLAERVDELVAVALLRPMVAAAIASVVFWIATEEAGVGDLRPYLFVQLASLALVPAAIALFRGPRGSTFAWAAAAGLYAAAKVAEVCDRAVLRATGAVSGHTLKHLAAAAAVGVLAAALRRRDIAPPQP